MSRSLGHRMLSRWNSHIRRTLASAVLLGLFAPSLMAQLPSAQLNSIFPAGGKAGTTVDVTITGGNLDDVDRLHFSHAAITAVRKTAEPGPFEKGPQPVLNTFVVTIGNAVPIGMYESRAIGKYGISNPRAFVVSDLPAEVVEIEPNNGLKDATELTLGSTVNGKANQAADVDYFKFTATAGQRVLVDCWAKRIDSRMDATVVVYDATGRELGGSRDASRRDPLVDFTVPANGEYFVKVYDVAYKGSNDYFYRLSVGTFPHIDFVFPPAGLAGSNGSYTIYGRNLPGGQPAGVSVDRRPLQKITANIALPAGAAAQNLDLATYVDSSGAFLDASQYRLKNAQGSSNPVAIGIATAPILTEKEPNNSPAQAQKVTMPCEYVGQFYPRGDRDWVTFDAKKDAVYALEVTSQRMGLSNDPTLVIQQVTTTEADEEQVKVLQTVNDFTATYGGNVFNSLTDDPITRFVVPADGTYRVLLRDNYSEIRTDPRLVYRLAIRAEQPDFRLVAAPATATAGLHLRKGGHGNLRVVAFRRDNFTGEIVVSATGLPSGVTCAPVTIGPSSTSAMLVLAAADNAAVATGFIQVVGKSKIGAAAVTRTARAGTGVWLAPRQNNVPRLSENARLARNIAFSVSTTELAPYSVKAGTNKVYEVSRAGVLKIPYTATRRGNFKAKIDMTPADFPANVTTPGNKFSINPNVAAGEFTLKIAPTAPVGTYTLFLKGLGVVSYSRNPEAAKAAAARKVVLDKIAVDTAAAAKTATAAKAVADKAATDTTTAVTNAITAKTAADKAAADAATAVKTATTAQVAATKAATDAAALLKTTTAAKVVADKAVVATTLLAKNSAAAATLAKAALAKNPADQALATANVNATKAAADATAKAKVATDAAAVAAKNVVDATAKAKTATDAKVAADKVVVDGTAKAKTATDGAATAAKALADAMTKAKAAAEAKVKADKIAEDAVALSKAAVAAKVQSDQRATATANAAKPKNVNVFGASTAVQIKIAPAPITMKATAPAAALKQGAKLELPVTVARLFGYAEAVTLSAAIPTGVGGLQIPNATIAKGQTASKLVITAAVNATPGTHTLTVRATARYNNQNLTVDEKVTFKIDKVDPPKTAAK